jgi:hypothetical protein
MYQRPARYFVFSLLIAAPLAIAQTDSSLWRFVHPKAKAVIGINWGRIQQTSAGELMRERMGNFALPLPGLQFLKDIDRVIISSTGNPNPDQQTDAPILIAVRGHFNLAEVRKALIDHGAKRQMYGEFQVYRPQEKGGKDLAIVPLDAQTLLIGDAGSIFSSLEHNGYSVAEGSPAITRATALDSAFDFWAVVTSPQAVASQRLMGLFTGEELGEKARGFEAGISFRDGMAMNLNIETQSEDVAKKLSATISKMVNLSAKDKPTNPGLADLERKLKVGVEKNAVTITLRMNKEELAKAAEKFDQFRREKQKQLVEAKPAEKVTIPAAPPPKMVIRIDGLESGTREIPYKQ